MSSSPDHRVRLALIGAGEVTLFKHLPSLARVPAIEVAAIADLDRQAALRAANLFAIPRVFTTVEDTLDALPLDAVGICVPPAAHAAVALPALRAGKPLWIDKPLAVSEDDCHLIRRASDESGAPVQLGFHMRSHRLVERARAILASGALGEIESIRSVWNSPRSDDGLPPWRWDACSGGGALFELAVHHFDLWRFLLAREILDLRAVSRHGSRDDESALVSARLQGGVLATAHFSERAPHQVEIEICGSAGRLRLDCLRFDGLELFSSRDIPGQPAVRFRALASFAGSLPAGLSLMRNGGDYRESYRRAWTHFARVVRGSAQPAASLEDGLHATAAARAAIDSRPPRPAPSAPPSSAGAPGSLLFSIVVPTFNRPAHVAGLLSSLAALDYPRDRFEVILVNDGGAFLPGLALAWPGLRLTCLQVPHGGCAWARHHGVLAARGRYLAFTDDDCRPAPHWLRSLEEAARLHPAAGFGGPVVNGAACLFAETSQLVVNTFTRVSNAPPLPVSYFPTNNLTLPRDEFCAIGGLDATWDIAGGEDRDLCARWIASGRQLRSVPGALVRHFPSLNLAGFWHQHFHYGRGAVRFRRSHPDAAPVRRLRVCLLQRAFVEFAPWKTLPVALLACLSQLATACGVLWQLRSSVTAQPSPAPQRSTE